MTSEVLIARLDPVTGSDAGSKLRTIAVATDTGARRVKSPPNGSDRRPPVDPAQCEVKHDGDRKKYFAGPAGEVRRHLDPPASRRSGVNFTGPDENGFILVRPSRVLAPLPHELGEGGA